MSTVDYPAHHAHVQDLMGKLAAEIPDQMGGFSELHHRAVEDGALSMKTKELIALAIGINVRCDGCIGFHVHDALEAGATRAEVLETIGVAIMMGGGPSVVYGAEAFSALEQFEQARQAVAP